MKGTNRSDTMMGPWETAPVEAEEEELDIFAELGAVRPNAVQAAPQQQPATFDNSSDPLAMFMDEDEEPSLMAGESTFSITTESTESSPSTVEAHQPTPEPAPEAAVAPVSSEVVTELLEILVKKELHSRIQRGEDWLSDLPAEAIAQIESAKVVKDQQAYHLSLIIDMVGTGEVRPFATVLSTDQGTLPVAPPPQIPQTWHPLYNALRELLLHAMNSLTAIRVVSN
jgi:hypothetical protein